MERDKLLARERARDLWRFMQLIEASRHRAELLEIMAADGPNPYRTVLADVAAELRDFADQLHDLWRSAEPRDSPAPVLVGAVIEPRVAAVGSS